MCAAPIDKPVARIGRYVIFGEIAAGGMATVHYGRLLGEAGFSRTVAIKRMHPHCAEHPDFRAMLVDEARLVERIRHPNVVAIWDVVSLHGELYLIMEHVHGETLSRLIRIACQKDEPIPVEVASSIMHGVLLGLHAAHEATNEDGTPLAIVHRDVSPQNIMVSTDGAARVLDFGIAKASIRSQVTRDGQLKGKLQYVAPEQIRHQPVDKRCDVYSASVVLWEVLAGRRLFDADNEAATLCMVLEGQIDDLGELRPDVPEALHEVIKRVMALSVHDRFETAQDMAIALEKATTVATPRKVANWLKSLAATRLEKRADELTLVEKSTSQIELLALPDASQLDLARNDPEVSSFPTIESSGDLAFPTSSPLRKRIITGLGIAAIAVLIIMVAYASFGNGTAATPVETAAAPAPSSTPPSAVPEPPDAPPDSSAPTQNVAETDADPTKTTRIGRPAATARHPKTAPTQPKPEASSSHGKTSPCNPPYTIDDEGFRVPKPHCVD